MTGNLFHIPRIVIAGTHSGVGKTSLCIGIIRALTERGLKVAAFKCGPDYLDPTYHRRAGGSVSTNLDSWLMERHILLQTFKNACQGCDIAIIEGVMGLYDGLTPTSDEASTAQIAKWLRGEVILTVDGTGMARSAAALIQGFCSFDAELTVGGVIFNRVASLSHAQILKQCAGDHPVVLGSVLKHARGFNARHLGLTTAQFDEESSEVITAYAEAVKATIDLDQLCQIARNAPPLDIAADPTVAAATARVTIAYAYDEAFHFYYAYNLDLLRQQGAHLIRFSPLHDTALPAADGYLLGGGYPELYADKLAAGSTMKEQLRRAAADGKPIYAECGGLIYLANRLTTIDQQCFPMVGLIPGDIVMHDKLVALGYVAGTTTTGSPLGPSGTQFRGHQFRYSELHLTSPEQSGVPCAYTLTKPRTGATSAEGYLNGSNILASYVHVHWGSNPQIAAAFVNACERAREDGHG